MGTFVFILRSLEPQLARPFCQSPFDCIFKGPFLHLFQNQLASPGSSDSSAKNCHLLAAAKLIGVLMLQQF